MKKLIVMLLSISALSAYADEAAYSKCQSTINKVFTQSGDKSFFSKPVFSIDKFGRLVESRDIAIKKYVEGDPEHIFRFNDKLQKRKKFKEFSYNVEKDKSGRVLSIEQTNCENCNTRVEFKFIKGRCVPEKVYAVTPENEKILKADVEICRNIVKLNNEQQKALKKKQSCMKYLKGYQIELEGILKTFKPKIADENQLSTFVSSYEVTEKSLIEISKQVSLSEELSQADIDHAEGFSSLVKSCTDNFSKMMLKINTGIFYENDDGVYQLDVPGSQKKKLRSENRKNKVKRVKKNKKVISED